MQYLTYIWVDGHGKLRSKVKLQKGQVDTVKDCPVWNYDGSSCHQADTSNSEVTLIPVSLRDDFLNEKESKLNKKLVLCETFTNQLSGPMQPALKNFRTESKEVFEKNCDLEPWFGFGINVKE